MKKLLLSAAALVVLFAACSKEDDDKNTPQTTAKKYLQYITSSEDSMDVTYDAANSMKKIFTYTRYDNSTELEEFIYENGKPTKKTSTPDGEAARLTQTYEYNSAGKLLKVIDYSYEGPIYRYDSLGYDANGRLTVVYSHVRDNEDNVNNTYHINGKLFLTWDSKGNIIRQADVSGPVGEEDSVMTDFTYDDKVNFASRQPEFFLQNPTNVSFGLSANNVITSINVANSAPLDSINTTKEYTYDEDGYPVTQKEVEKVLRGTHLASMHVENFKYRYIKK